MTKGKPFLEELLKRAELGKWTSMVELAKPQSNDVVLDIGTGSGNTAIYLSNKVKSVIAIDSNPEHLEVAKEKAKQQMINNIEFIQMEVKDSLKWEDNTFTLVCCRAALHHLSCREKIFREVTRILKPKGRFDIMDPVVSENLRIFWTPISRMGESDHFSYCTYFELMKLFRDCKLEVRHMVPFKFKRDLNEWLSRFNKFDSSGSLHDKALELITEFMPSDLRYEIDLHINQNGKWEFSYNGLEIVAFKK